MESIFKYLSEGNHKNSKVIEKDLNGVLDTILGTNTPWTAKFQEQLGELVEKFDGKVTDIWKKVPIIDQWSKAGQVLLTILPTLPYLMFTLVWLIQKIFCTIENREIVREMSQLESQKKK